VPQQLLKLQPSCQCHDGALPQRSAGEQPHRFGWRLPCLLSKNLYSQRAAPYSRPEVRVCWRADSIPRLRQGLLSLEHLDPRCHGADNPCGGWSPKTWDCNPPAKRICNLARVIGLREPSLVVGGRCSPVISRVVQSRHSICVTLTHSVWRALSKPAQKGVRDPGFQDSGILPKYPRRRSDSDKFESSVEGLSSPALVLFVGPTLVRLMLQRGRIGPEDFAHHNLRVPQSLLPLHNLRCS
jgi:hypothetical protein